MVIGSLVETHKSCFISDELEQGLSEAELRVWLGCHNLNLSPDTWLRVWEGSTRMALTTVVSPPGYSVRPFVWL